MTIQPAQSSATKTYQIITDKRQALESLIKIAQGVHEQHSALSELAYAALPSQEFPVKVVLFFDAIEKRMADLPSPEIIRKLETVEKVTEQSLRQMLHLATLDVAQLRAQQIDALNPESFKTFIDDFRNRTNTALAIRLLLKKKGLAIAPFKLPVPQETIAAQISRLKEKEVACVKEVRKEIYDIIRDSQALLTLTELDQQLRQQLADIVSGMHANLAHLDNGGSITEIPNEFEIITLQSEEVVLVDATAETNAPKQPATTAPVEETVAKTPAITPDQEALDNRESPSETQLQKRSFWWIFKLWLTSPWNTRWSDLTKKYRPK